MAFDWFNPDGGGAAGITPDVEAVASWEVAERAHNSILTALWNLERRVEAASRGNAAAVPANVRDAMRAIRGAVTQAAVDWTTWRDLVRRAVAAAIQRGRLTPEQVSMLREGGLAGVSILLAVAVLIVAAGIAVGIAGGGFHAARGVVAQSNARAQAIIAQNAAIVAAWERSVGAAAPGAPLPPLPAPNVPDPWPDAAGNAAGLGLVAAVVLAAVFLFRRKG